MKMTLTLALFSTRQCNMSHELSRPFFLFPWVEVYISRIKRDEDPVASRLVHAQSERGCKVPSYVRVAGTQGDETMGRRSDDGDWGRLVECFVDLINLTRDEE